MVVKPPPFRYALLRLLVVALKPAIPAKNKDRAAGKGTSDVLRALSGIENEKELNAVADNDDPAFNPTLAIVQANCVGKLLQTCDAPSCLTIRPNTIAERGFP